ncbi:MAG TPA: hypothetical protein VEW42_00035 [Candidatus Eisenbacteria bacterium]|nr:hypothetical protein [Candidatus Eisenbacteria bacterium]
MGRIDDNSAHGSIEMDGDGQVRRIFPGDEGTASPGSIVRDLMRRQGVNRDSLQEFLSRRGPQNNKQSNGNRGNS